MKNGGGKREEGSEGGRTRNMGDDVCCRSLHQYITVKNDYSLTHHYTVTDGMTAVE